MLKPNNPVNQLKIQKMKLKLLIVCSILFASIQLKAQDCSNADTAYTYNLDSLIIISNLYNVTASATDVLSNHPVNPNFMDYTPQRDFWVKFTAPVVFANIILRYNDPNNHIASFEIYSGTCDNLELLGYAEAGLTVTNPTIPIPHLETAVLNLTIGQTYYIRIIDYTLVNPGETLAEQYRLSINYNCVCIATPEVSTVDGSSTSNCDGPVQLKTTMQNGVPVQWYKDGIAIPNATDSIYSATQTGTYKVIADTTTCAKNSNDIYVVTGDASITILGESAICNGQSTLLQATQGIDYSYQWSQNDILIPNSNSSSLLVNQPGTYSVEITNSTCVSSFQTIIAAGEIPTAPLISSLNGLVLCNGNILEVEGVFEQGVNYQWTHNGTDILNANSINYFIDVEGVYCLEVSNDIGCKDTSNCLTVSNCVGFDLLTENGIEIYPNPVAEFLYIKTQDQMKDLSIAILDMQGRLLNANATVSSNGLFIIPVSELSNGIYLIRLGSSKGHINKRFVKSE